MEVLTMSKVKQIILAYSLTYVSLALAINGSYFFPIIIILFSVLLLKRNINPGRAHNYKSIYLTIPQLGLLILSFNQILYINLSFLLCCAYIIGFNIFHLFVLESLSQKKQFKILGIESLLFIFLTTLVGIMDIIVRKYTGFGVLTGFWYLLISLGSNIFLNIVYVLINTTSLTSIKNENLG